MTLRASYTDSPDYELGLRKLRRLRSLAGLLLLLALLTQLVLFFLARYDVIEVSEASAGGAFYRVSELSPAESTLHYVLGGTASLSVLLAVVLVITVIAEGLLIVVSRRLGVAATISALLWSLVLLVLVFPSQLFFGEAALSRSVFALPGAVFTFGELRTYGLDADDWGSAGTYFDFLRFAVAPLAAIIVLMLALIKSGRGFKLALGEIDLNDTVSSEPSDTVA